jgi:hypothetical protein
MKRLIPILAIALCAAACLPAGAQADHPSLGNFGINGFDVTFTNKDGETETLAGAHPFAMTTTLKANVDGKGKPEGWLKDFFAEFPPGMVADATAYEQCTNADFIRAEGGSNNSCPLNTQIGVNAVSATEAGKWTTSPVYNLTPPPGVLLRLGFSIVSANITVDAGLSPNPPYNGLAASRNIAQLVEVIANKVQLWGNPSDPAHDKLRGQCGIGGADVGPGEEFEFEDSSSESCKSIAPNSKPLIDLPTFCAEPLRTSFEAFSWEGEKDSGTTLTHDAEGNPQPFTDCAGLGFKPSITAKPTTRAAQSPTGLDFSLDVEDEGLTSVTGRSQSRIKKLVVTLPEGMTANPSLAEGLEVCSQADLEHETLQSGAGEGCPEASKIGSVEVESPLVNQPLKGALYIAAPYENEFNSLLAIYTVIKNPALGIIVKQAAKVEPDPKTGQLVTTAENIPPSAAFSHFRLHFREGGRSPLVSPPLCGTYEAKAELTPWSGSAPIVSGSAFKIESGPGEGNCPPGGTPPFQPGFEAGSQNNAAAAYSPFSVRLTRRDGDQDLTRFDAVLPPGVLAKLAGVDKCSNAQISLAKTKTGKAELASPSCPAGSKIGTIQAGAGVGSQLTYVPGSLYLAGPFGGAPLSALAVVPAVAGPFDVGTVVVRQALAVNPRTGEVKADGAHSDPIPHILQGIPLVVRDIQVHVDRPNFTINPTNCNPFATKASIWGGGSNLFSSSDDSPVQREARYQAANCSRLGFKPKLSLKLKGGTRRGDHPKLRAVLQPRSGDANLAGTVVRLPRSAFLDQAHIRTICTRVQYAAKSCPAGAVYGHVRAFSPLLSEPLEGPAYLRSSDHKLPDLVFSLHGIVDFEAVARIDSKKGGIRATFSGVPDAPISKVVVNMQGAKKGLIVNSTNLCAQTHRANVQLDAQNGKRLEIKPVMQASCGKSKK